MRLGFELCPASEAQGEVGWVAQSNGENPYGIAKLKDSIEDPNSGKIDVILSIPSPYARWHIVEIGLEEASIRSFGETTGGTGKRVLAPVYQRAISHLLDMFELFYRFNGTELADLGIEVRKYNFEKKENLSKLEASRAILDYVDTLELYRGNYKKSFNAFYEISRYGQPIGITSPFTVFSVLQDISVDAEIHIKDYRTLFAHDRFSSETGKAQWAGIEEREEGFQKFLYSLLCKNYDQKNPIPLYSYVKTRMNQDLINVVESDANYFENHYPDFVIKGQAGIPLATDGQFGADIELLPLGYDTFVFENFLNTQKAHDYSCIKPEDYNTDIVNRKNIFSGESNNSLMWVTVDDLLEPVVFMTQSPIDEDKYLAVLVDDSNVIIPVKKTFFQLFNFFDSTGKLFSKETVREWFKIEKKTTGDAAWGEVNTSIYVTLSLPKKDGGRVSVTKIYQEENEQIKKINLDFGIYPFFQVNKAVHHDGPDNFYRMFLYLDGGDCLNDVKEDIKLYSLNLQNLLNPSPLVNDRGKFHIQSHSTINKINQESVGDNLYYVSLESNYYKMGQQQGYRDVRFNFIEVTISNFSFMIVPRFNVYSLGTAAEITVAYDLGTSNTFVACGRQQQDPIPFETAGFEELVGKFTKRKLVLDNTLGGPTNYDLHQLAEFLPTRFGAHEAHFPIQTVQLYVPTVTNDTELNAATFNIKNGAPYVSMFTMNVPFYYDRTGVRSLGNTDLDSPITGFKWFSQKGDECKEHNAFIMFVDQLAFMLRSKLILEQNLNTSYVKLVWTYPLALTEAKKGLFEDEWKFAYEKYFGGDVNTKILSFTESETPIESTNVATEHVVKVGIDIGGGTSDVIIYEPGQDRRTGNTVNNISLATSFSFAGNTMFSKLIGRDAEITNAENIWYKMMSSFIPQDMDNSGMHSKVVDLSPNGRNITEIMDYVFSHAMKVQERNVRAMMGKPYLKFISLMHISAIIWEVAKVCKMKLGEEVMPSTVALSGNGSKLIMLSEMDGTQKKQLITALVRYIFHVVYNKPEQQIKVVMLDQPKRATAYGAIKLANNGCHQSKANNCYYIPFCGKIYLQDNSQLRFGEFESATSVESTPQSTVSSGASSLDLLFGASPKTTPVEEPAVNRRDDSVTNKPTIDSIMSNWEEIAKEVGEFMDFYYQLSASPLGGGISSATCQAIRNEIFGSTTTYNTNKMKDYIKRAKEIIAFNARQAAEETETKSEIKESVFLQVIAVQLASTIKMFGSMIDK